MIARQYVSGKERLAMRRGLVARSLIKFACQASWSRDTDRYYDCGPELGTMRLYYEEYGDCCCETGAGWTVDWIVIGEFPIDPDGLVKGEK